MAFDQTNGNLQGYSVGVEFAVNPIAVNPTKTRFHEIGHIVLGHTIASRHEEYVAHRGLMEFEAEAVAFLAMNELGVLDERTAEVSRGYIQHWLRDERPPDKAIQLVFRAADVIWGQDVSRRQPPTRIARLWSVFWRIIVRDPRTTRPYTLR